jgi:hypothetical protein
MVWKNTVTKQIVTPEIVVRIFLSAFLIKGSDAYIQPNRDSTESSAQD